MSKMNTSGNPSRLAPSPGFFHGLYGGPRVNPSQNLAEFNQNVNFIKSGTENLSLSSPSKEDAAIQNSGSVEPLGSDILEGCVNPMDQIGKRVQVILRDGRILVGELASVDQFSNLLLRDAVERIVVGKRFGDIIRGIFIIRGDNVLIIGEIDAEREAKMETILEQVPLQEILVAQKIEQDEKIEKQLKYTDARKQRGVSFPRPLEEEF